MASSKEFLDFVLEQLSDLDGVTYRPMMGEYILYVDGKVVGGLYDDRLLVKPVKGAKALLPDAPLQLPYEGGSDMLFVDEVDDRLLLADLFRTLATEVPAKKKK